MIVWIGRTNGLRIASTPKPRNYARCSKKAHPADNHDSTGSHSNPTLASLGARRDTDAPH